MLVGLSVGILFAIVLALLTSLPTPVRGIFRAVERAGIDAGMRIYALSLSGRQALPRFGGKPEPGYYFIDIDEQACTQFFVEEPVRCQG